MEIAVDNISPIKSMFVLMYAEGKKNIKKQNLWKTINEKIYKLNLFVP